MNKEEIDNQLAELVMGYQVGSLREWYQDDTTFYWSTEKIKDYIRSDHWSPSSNIRQAMMAVSKAKKTHPNLYLELKMISDDNLFVAFIIITLPDAKSSSFGYGSGKDPAFTVSKALLECLLDRKDHDEQ